MKEHKKQEVGVSSPCSDLQAARASRFLELVTDLQ